MFSHSAYLFQWTLFHSDICALENDVVDDDESWWLGMYDIGFSESDVFADVKAGWLGMYDVCSLRVMCLGGWACMIFVLRE